MTTLVPARHPELDALVRAILRFLGERGLLALDEARAELEREVALAGPDGVSALRERLSADHGWGYYPPDPLARRIHHLLAGRFLHDDSGVSGVDHVAAVEDVPVAMLANHLSYADANVIEVLLHRAGADRLADRLTALAGPKVFTSRERRFSSLCFGTIKVPQSTGVSSGEAVASARQVARAARRAMDMARDRLRAGDALLLFGEGTRSRTGAMQRLLPGVARYLDVPGTWVLPAGLTGSDALFPVGESTLRPARVTVRLGSPLSADRLLARAGGDRRLVVDAIGLAVARLLPVSSRGAYAREDEFLQARRVLDDLRPQAP